MNNAMAGAVSNMSSGAKGQKGFTLVELLIVLLIIGILSAIAIPMFLGQREKAQRAEAQQNLQSLRALMEQYNNENGSYPTAASPYTGLAAIQGVLPAWKPGSGLLFNYRIEATATTYVIGADLSPNAVSAGAACASGEMKIDNNNNKCGFQ